MPRFKIEYSAQLNDALSRVGMGIAFEPNKANFSKMASGLNGLCIGQVRHKTYLDVNEEGTVAAAATSVGMMAMAIAAPVDRFTMNVDHPFLCVIREKSSGAIVFLGEINDPAK
jgi:serpin B